MPSKAPQTKNANVPFQAIQPGESQNVTIAGASAPTTNAFQGGTSIVRLVATSACYVKFGTAPVATTSDMYLPADTPEYFAVKEGASWKVAVIQASAGGTLNVTEGDGSNAT